MELKQKMKAWIVMSRPLNVLSIGLASLTGAIMTHAHINDLKLILLFASPAIIGAAGNIINDYFDAPIDRINKPHRPIPSGIIKEEEARLASIILFIIGTALSLPLGLMPLLIAVLASVLLYSYSYSLKRRGFIGNITIAFLSALCFPFGSLSTGTFSWTIVFPSFYAFSLILGREIVKVVEDLAGDSVAGVRTLAIMLGPRRASLLSILPLMSVIILSPLPFLVKIGSFWYLIIAISGVDVPLAYSILKMLTWKGIDEVAKVRALLKVPIMAGILAFVIGGAG
ncbi:MAG: hypothetical protein DRN15_10310 [Thermoprotei archaeon]|nr:MAG: hypothetical protein DRN15_10310 [Thermoprotei archaeon]